MEKLGRNDRCPCGSGKKYKQCCMASNVEDPRPTTSPTGQMFQMALDQHRMGQARQAEQLCQQILRAQPRHADALNLAGVIAGQSGHYEIAVEHLKKAIEISPNRVAYYSNLGLSLQGMGRVEEAIDCYERALKLNPNLAEALNSLGHLRQSERDLDAAVGYYRRAIECKPNYAEAHYNLGKALEERYELDASIASYEQALSLRPHYAEALNNLGFVMQLQGRLDLAAERYRQAFSLGLNNSGAYSNYLMMRQYDPAYTREAMFADHLAFADRFEAPLRARWPRHANPRDSERRLNIGFVSGDFRQHPVGYFLESVLSELDREQLNITLYATHPQIDALTERLRAGALQWSEMDKLSDEQAAESVRADGIDILVDLSGHTAGNRMQLFARKPAPVQVTWLGYWSTTGLRAIDYILCDRRGVPEDEKAFFVEEPWYLPNTRLCFTPPEHDVAVAELPALSAGHITFGCFNNLTKMSDAVVALWSRILHETENSMLLLKTKQLEDEHLQEKTRQRFAVHGIGAERLSMEGHTDRADYLAAYHRIDFALDPFPFTGATTSSEGIWMGVPFVTLRGGQLISRQGETILHNLGLGDWVANDEEDYLARALRHAADLNGLAQLRAQLRPRLLASPLCDAPRFARHLEAAFRAMWRRYCES